MLYKVLLVKFNLYLRIMYRHVEAVEARVLQNCCEILDIFRSS